MKQLLNVKWSKPQHIFKNSIQIGLTALEISVHKLAEKQLRL